MDHENRKRTQIAALPTDLNHSRSTVTLIDFFGLDTPHFVAGGLLEESKEQRLGAPTLLRRMITGDTLDASQKAASVSMSRGHNHGFQSD